MIPDLLSILLLSLATYRISRLIVADTFPPVRIFRDWLKFHWPNHGDIVKRRPKRGSAQPLTPGLVEEGAESWRVIQGTHFGYFISCMYCLPFWVGTLIFAAWYWFPEPTLLFCVPWSLASIAMLIHRWESR